MGTPDFAVPALTALLDAGHSIVQVYSQPPRPAGRGQRVRSAPVAEFAAGRGIAVATPRTLRTPETRAEFAGLPIDAAVVVAYGLILPKPILDAPRLGCLNIHASLLPRWRGAAPIQRAILAGDRETGVTIMRMDEGLDTGAMLLTDHVSIEPGATAGELHDRLATLGAKLIVQALIEIEAGRSVAQPQSNDGVTYAAKIEKDETRLDWSRHAEELERRVRAFAPYPGAWFICGDERIRVLGAKVESTSGAPGAALDDRLLIGCGVGALRLNIVQRAGRAAMSAAQFLRGFPIAAGTELR